ncbi:ubiquitin domain-containing protein TINCR-like [Latimeria chalumnae]|uniref:ubiquitin domain-containing protein TINCR-like n=1 Tax=Latimeria chalumnae TaxID=7897 RepID=UPI00313D5A9A
MIGTSILTLIYTGMESVRKLLAQLVRYNIMVQLPQDEQVVPVTVRPSDTMRDLRVQLVKQGITSWRQVFVYKGKQLGENETVKNCKIQNGSVLLLAHDS